MKNQKPRSVSNSLPKEETGAIMANSSVEERKFEYLFRAFELYTNVQVNADTVYHNRTSVITLTEGLLFLGYQSLVQKGSDSIKILAFGIAAVGLILSMLWLMYEQRNAIYFQSRCKVLEDLENDLLAQASEARAAFKSFWNEVPKWVKANASWYQRVSGPLIIRVLVPLLFVVSWLILLFATPRVFKPDKAVNATTSVEAKSSPTPDVPLTATPKPEPSSSQPSNPSP